MASGRCICGAVAFEVRGPLRDVVLCHCTECRRWAGHAWAGDRGGVRRPEFSEERGLSWIDSPDSEYDARRGFCGECGSSLFWHAPGSGPVSIAAGCLDAPTGIAPSSRSGSRRRGLLRARRADSERAARRWVRRRVNSRHGELSPHLLPHRRHRPLRLLLREARLRGAGADEHRRRGRQRLHGPAGRGPRARADLQPRRRLVRARHRLQPHRDRGRRPRRHARGLSKDEIQPEKPPYRPGGRTEGP